MTRRPRQEPRGKRNCCCSGGLGPPISALVASARSAEAQTNMHFTQEYFERRPGLAVKSNRLRRFGRPHVSRICCFSACAARILFFGTPVRPVASDSVNFS